MPPIPPKSASGKPKRLTKTRFRTAYTRLPCSRITNATDWDFGGASRELKSEVNGGLKSNIKRAINSSRRAAGPLRALWSCFVGPIWLHGSRRCSLRERRGYLGPVRPRARIITFYRTRKLSNGPTWRSRRFGNGRCSKAAHSTQNHGRSGSRMSRRRDFRDYLADIQQAAQKAIAFVQGFTKDSFTAD